MDDNNRPNHIKLEVDNGLGGRILKIKYMLI